MEHFKWGSGDETVMQFREGAPKLIEGNIPDLSLVATTEVLLNEAFKPANFASMSVDGLFGRYESTDSSCVSQCVQRYNGETGKIESINESKKKLENERNWTNGWMVKCDDDDDRAIV